MLLNKEQAKNKINQLSVEGQPFFFVIDFEEIKCQVYAKHEIPDHILFNIRNTRNYYQDIKKNKFYQFEKYPISFNDYDLLFKQVNKELHYGNSFLLNLTSPTPIECDLSLKEIFYNSQAAYKLWIKDQCVVFSPETFVKITDGVISSYPMKGTIDASLPDAQSILINNEKEKAEHLTIVDLIRNDLSIYAHNVHVSKFRYIDRIHTNDKDLLQMSSEIVGQLPSNYREILGDILFSMLPAGSISGAPKAKTIEIIQKAENLSRGYYTGIMGYFDGNNLDSGVLIRYIEEDNNQKIYRSGGGITHLSQAKEEYQEMIDKVYLPFK